MLTAVEIKNFRGIKEGKVEGLNAVNVVVGPNGSGKSSLLEAIFLGAASDGIFMLPGEPARDVLKERHNESVYPSSNLYYGKDDSQEIGILYSFGSSDTFHSIKKTEHLWEPADRTEEIRLFFNASKLLDLRHLLDKKIENKLWEEILNVRADRGLTQMIQDVYKLEAEGFSYSPSSQVLKVLLRDRDFALSVDDLGAGLRVALRILMAASLTKNGALLIEEFDAFQHVNSMPKLAIALVSLAKKNNVQLFLTTHNEETITSFIGAVETVGLGLTLIQTKLSPDGLLETASLATDRTSRLIDAGIDVRKAG